MMQFYTAALPSLWDGTCIKTHGVCSGQDFLLILANGIRLAMALAGALAVVIIVVGGIYYVISSGEPQKIKQAREIMTNAVTGLVIASLGYIIVSFVAGQF